MYSDARNWKWMVPGAAFGLAMLLTRSLMLSPFEWIRWAALVSGLTAAVCAIASVGNLIDYRRAAAVTMFERKRNAMAITPLSAELTAARGVHPDAVKLLINERHRVWMMKSGVKSEGVIPHSVLFGAPNVTEFFLQYFLESSTETMVMPKRLLSDKRKNRFDPWGAVTEYVMYDHLIALLERQGKVHKWSEYEQYEWVDPWTPALVAEDYGLEWEEEVISDQLSAVSEEKGE